MGQIQNVPGPSQADFNTLSDQIGDISTLTTTDKTTVVNAINEIVGLLGGFKCKQISNGTDLDTLRTTGIYMAYDGTYPNAPTTATTRFAMLVLSGRAGYAIQLIGMATQSGGIWARKLLNGSFGAWTQIVSL